MKVIKNTRFILTFNEYVDEPNVVCQCYLPNPDDGPYEFRNCEIHPRLWSAIHQQYLPHGSVLTGTTYVGPYATFNQRVDL